MDTLPPIRADCCSMFSDIHVLVSVINKSVQPLRGRPLWGRPCSWVCAYVTGRIRKQAVSPYYIRESTNHRLEILIIRLTLTQLLCPVTLTFDPLTSKFVHGVLVSQGPFLPSFVFVGFFVFPLAGGTGQTDGRTDGQHRYNQMWGGKANFSCKQTWRVVKGLSVEIISTDTWEHDLGGQPCKAAAGNMWEAAGSPIWVSFGLIDHDPQFLRMAAFTCFLGHQDRYGSVLVGHVPI